MKFLTVFTPTYNRAYCIENLYRSLCDQNNKNFIWLVVDDGSKDNTRELVQVWIEEKIIEIQYFYKENGGMHTAHNLAYTKISTELNVCIDSDDKMPKDAVNNILLNWEKVKNKESIAGMVGLDADFNNNLIGTTFPKDKSFNKFHLLYQKYEVKGDKKVVLRTNLVKNKIKYPEFEGERLVPLSYLYYTLDRDYDFYCCNEIWANVDYQPNGSSATINKQYFISPQGFRFAKAHEYDNSLIWKYKIKAIIHFGFTSLIIKDYFFFLKSPNVLLSIIFFPISFYFYFKNKLKLKGNN